MHAHGSQVRAPSGDRYLLPYGASHRRQASALLQYLLHTELQLVLHPVLQYFLLHSLLQEVPSLPLGGSLPARSGSTSVRGEVENLASFAFL
jgi:hypothetical protein